MAIVLVVLPLTYLSVVLGELVPKSLALRFPMRFALGGGLLIQFLDKIFAPFIFVLEISTRGILRLISGGAKSETPNELNTSVDLEPLSDSNKQYVLNLIHIDKKMVKDIYLPWDQVSQVHFEDHYTVVLQTIKESRHTRLPVLREGRVIGLLHAKEFVAEGEISRLDWTELIRPVLSLSPKETILAALKALQSKHSHLGIVRDGSEILGIVTLEDIFEEVVGEIGDDEDNPRALLSTNAKIRRPTI